jgi:hypothetical protein
MGRFQGAITPSLTKKCNKLLSLIYKRHETIIIRTSNLNNFTQYRPIHSYAQIQTPELKYALLILPKYELGKVPRVVIVMEHSFKTKSGLGFDLDCNHPHNILLSRFALLEHSSCVADWSRREMQGRPSSVMARQEFFC